MPIGIHSIGSSYRDIVEKAEALAAMRIKCRGHSAQRASMMARGADCTESVPSLLDTLIRSHNIFKYRVLHDEAASKI